MKLITLLPLAALGTALVVVDETLLRQIPVEKSSKSFFDRLPSEIISEFKQTYNDMVEHAENAIDKAIDAALEVTPEAQSSFQCHESMTAFDTESWLEDVVWDDESLDVDRPRKPPHHKKPHRRHGRSNKTIYELISSSKYTTKLAKLIGEYDDLVETLNGTSANYTLFAPTDAAFKKIPHHHKKKPSKQLIRNVLAYHVSPDFYPAGRVLVSHTIPSSYREERLGGELQRLRVGFSLVKGLNINFYSKIVAVDIFAANGVIHGVDSIILPAPPVWKILELLPGEFSTLQLALVKTGLADVLKNSPHLGGTVFAPSNHAFKMLGPKINGFLFSKYGEKYLKALLKYHVVANQTLYSDAFYNGKDASDTVDVDNIPKSRSHVDLPTLLDGKSLSIDIARFGGLITIRINGFNNVAVQDGIASDGVIQVLGQVLIPPKTPGGLLYQGEELAVEDLKERLSEYVEEKSGWFDL